MTAEAAETTPAAAPRRSRRAEPERRCIVTGEVLPKEALIRFVIGPEDQLVPDLAERLPGRGFWCSARRDVIEKACARRLFAKAARGAVVVPADLAERLEAALRQRCLDIVGLARRAGEAVAGFEKTKAWLASGRAALLLEALDGDGDGARRLRALAKASDSKAPLIRLFSADELGRAFGRSAVVHAALAGKLAARLASESARLAGMTETRHPSSAGVAGQAADK